jgi:hypothetical protein
MDPNATFSEWLAAVVAGDLEEAARAHADLREWLACGGFEPRWSKKERDAFVSYDPKSGMTLPSNRGPKKFTPRPSTPWKSWK